MGCHLVDVTTSLASRSDCGQIAPLARGLVPNAPQDVTRHNGEDGFGKATASEIIGTLLIGHEMIHPPV